MHIFISYSHRDKHYLDEFLRFLRDGPDVSLDVWSDEKLEAAVDFDEEIAAAIAKADIAVLLASQSLLSSKYINERELPLLFRARDAGQLRITALYLTAGLFDRPISYTTENGEQRSTTLTRFQGLNRPNRNEFIAAQQQPRQEELFTRAARGLLQMASGSHLPIERERRSYHAVGDGPARPELLIRLSRNGDRIHRIYAGDSGKIAEDVRLWTPTSCLREVIDDPRKPDIESVGDELYRLLFGELGTRDWDTIQRHITSVGMSAENQSSVHLIRVPTRLRIQTEDPLVSSLPWSLIRFKDRYLVDNGWTIEQVSEQDNDLPPMDVVLRAPCTVLIINGSEKKLKFEPVLSFQDLMYRAWPGPTHAPPVGVSIDQLNDCFSEQAFDVVYVQASSGAADDGAELVFGDESTPCTIEELVRAWCNHPPKVAFFNITTDKPFPAAMLTPVVDAGTPLVVLQSYGFQRHNEAHEAALGFFHDLLGSGRPTDPVRLIRAHGLPSAQSLTRYRHWSTETPQGPTKRELATLLLDRKLQRRFARGILDELLRDPERRLSCLLAFGANGNLMERAAAQIHHHLRRHASKAAHVSRRRLPLPSDLATFTLEDVDAVVLGALGADRIEDIPKRLAAFRPRAGGHSRAVILLDWGVRGESTGTAIAPSSLHAWLEFNLERIAAVCPDKVRFLSCLTIESSSDRIQKIESAAKSLRLDPLLKSNRLSFEALPRLDDVEAEDLVDFLKGSDSSCPDSLVMSIAQLIFESSQGRFDDTTELLESGEMTSWYALHDRLSEEGQAPRSHSLPEDEF